MQEEYEEPDPNNPEVTPYQLIGGDAAIRKLVDRFYELMDELPEAYGTRKIHPADLTESANKFFDFLSGWLGGPQRFEEKYGPPMLRRRHMLFAIGEEERDQWLMCMKQALEETVANERLRNILYEQFVQIGESMRNRGENLQGCCHH